MSVEKDWGNVLDPCWIWGMSVKERERERVRVEGERGEGNGEGKGGREMSLKIYYLCLS